MNTEINTNTDGNRKKSPNKALAVVCLIIILAIAGGYAAYFSWSARGDTVQFSPTGRWGWGTTPEKEPDGKVIGTIHSYLIVRDIQSLNTDAAIRPGARIPAGGAAHHARP